MLRTIQAFGLARPILLFAACSLAAVSGCSSRGLPPNVAASQPQDLPALKEGQPSPNIYIANQGDGTLTTYTYDGTPTSPTITDGLRSPNSVAVDTNGKIYVANGNGTVTTYDQTGKRTHPTIRVRKSFGLTVDNHGKIYVGNGGQLTTYNPDGSRTTPTIRFSFSSRIHVRGVAVDASGKIFVTVFQRCRRVSTGGCFPHNYVLTYDATGSRSTPKIDLGQQFRPAGGVAVDANGKIYVANGSDEVSTYMPDGSRTAPTIRFGDPRAHPLSVAVDESGKIYVTVSPAGRLMTFNPDGSAATPTIAGLSRPDGVALY